MGLFYLLNRHIYKNLSNGDILKICVDREGILGGKRRGEIRTTKRLYIYIYILYIFVSFFFLNAYIFRAGPMKFGALGKTLKLGLIF
jgi:hypothetical protein